MVHKNIFKIFKYDRKYESKWREKRRIRETNRVRQDVFHA